MAAAAEIRIRTADDGLRREIDAPRLGSPIWFEVDAPKGMSPAQVGRLTPEAALIAILPRAMKAECDLAIDAPVDARLLAGLDHFQDVWRRWRPDVFRRKAVIHAPASSSDGGDTRDAPGATRPAIAAFSAGVDSSFTLLRHRRGPAFPGQHRIETAVMVHGFDMPLDATVGFQRMRDKGRAITDALGLRLITLRTNWRDSAPNWQMSFGAGLAAVLHQFADYHATGLIATEEAYDNSFTVWGNSFWNDRFFSSSRFSIESDGGAFDRIDRTRALAAAPDLLPHLTVCWAGPRDGGNCGVCAKCVLTKLNFAIAGRREGLPFPTPIVAEEILAMPIGTAWQARFLAIIEQRMAGMAAPDGVLLAAIRSRLAQASADGHSEATRLARQRRLPAWRRLANRLMPPRFRR